LENIGIMGAEPRSPMALLAFFLFSFDVALVDSAKGAYRRLVGWQEPGETWPPLPLFILGTPCDSAGLYRARPTNALTHYRGRAWCAVAARRHSQRRAFHVCNSSASRMTVKRFSSLALIGGNYLAFTRMSA